MCICTVYSGLKTVFKFSKVFMTQRTSDTDALFYDFLILVFLLFVSFSNRAQLLGQSFNRQHCDGH